MSEADRTFASGERVSRLKWPSRSVETPIVVPSKYTLAKGMGSPVSASRTLPLTRVLCATALMPARTRANMRANLFNR